MVEHAQHQDTTTIQHSLDNVRVVQALENVLDCVYFMWRQIMVEHAQHQDEPLGVGCVLRLACMYVCTYVCMYVHMYVCMYICMYVYTYMCFCVYTYIYAYVCVCLMREKGIKQKHPAVLRIQHAHMRTNHAHIRTNHAHIRTNHAHIRTNHAHIRAYLMHERGVKQKHLAVLPIARLVSNRNPALALGDLEA